jgi:plasmid stability protein
MAEPDDFLVRIPRRFRTELERRATAAERSVAAEVRMIVKTAIEPHKPMEQVNAQ